MHKPLFIILFITCSSFQQLTGVDLVVKKAAEGQLPAFLDKIQQGNEGAFGFTADDDLDLVKPGKPYRMLIFNHDFYDNKLVEDKNYLIIQNEWRVPVSLKDTDRSLLIMQGNPGNYTIAEMGAPVLAKELQQKREGTDENDKFYLLQVGPLLADFFVTEHDNSFSEAQFIPLRSAIIAVPEFGKKPRYSLTEVEKIVKEALKPGAGSVHTPKGPVKEKQKK